MVARSYLLNHKADAVISHCLREARWLALLRKRGSLRKPLVVFVNSFPVQSYPRSQFNAFIVAGGDRLLALNSTAAVHMQSCGVPSERVVDFRYDEDMYFYCPTEHSI